MDRDTLLLGWFLLFVWLWVNFARADFSPRLTLLPHVPPWHLWILGAGLTIFLIHRRHRLAGPVGYVVVASLAGYCVLRGLAGWGWVFSPTRTADIDFAFSGLTLHARGYAAYLTFQALVPLAVLTRHIASRHRLMHYGGPSDIDTEIDTRRRPGGYYFVTGL